MKIADLLVPPPTPTRRPGIFLVPIAAVAAFCTAYPEIGAASATLDDRLAVQGARHPFVTARACLLHVSRFWNRTLHDRAIALAPAVDRLQVCQRGSL